MTYFVKPSGVIDRQMCQLIVQEAGDEEPADMTGWRHNAQVWDVSVLSKGQPSTAFQHSRELSNTLAILTIPKQ